MDPIGEYKAKRKFAKTPEPEGLSRKPRKKPLRFVVQKHQASSLHYDLRLEVDGVLKSWAVPKGPSQDPTKRHLAIKVEDHPLEYKDFEGVIPKGNYGAGTVMIWDEGFYRPLGALASGKDLTETFQAGLDKGHLVFALAGKKLDGEFALVKLGHGSKNDWLLIKARDWYASVEDILLQDKSARSGLTTEEIRKIIPRFPKIDSPKGPLPQDVHPMLATLVEQPFDKKGWIFEVKWDGYRAITEVIDGKPHIYSRNNKSFDDKFKEIYQSFVGYPKEAVFDGEIVAIDNKGRSGFQLLQDYLKTGRGTLIYYVFDILYLDGHDLTSLPLKKRREILKKVLPRLPNIQFSDDIPEKGSEFFLTAKKQGLEGILAKSESSTYQPGHRGRDWLKIKHHLQQEAIICGFTKPRGSRSGFGALVLGAFDKAKLTYIGDVGTGFDELSIANVMKKLKPLVRKRTPFVSFPLPEKNITWLKPELVCEIRFQEWTKDGYMRQPVFLGLREDKEPKNVSRERPKLGNRGKDVDPKPKTAFSNPNKIFWPKLGITKGDLLNYYKNNSKYILPHLKGRPESLNRFPDGFGGFSFFQKNIENPPEWMKTYIDYSGIDQHSVTYALCNGKKTLEYLINLGCIELNVWNSTVDHPDRPDFLVFDLDPVEIEYRLVLEAALTIHSILEKIGIKSYPKTSGKRGLHIYVPLAHKYTFEQARDFAHLISIEAHRQLPKTTSLERQPKDRQGKVYLDYLQNRKGATMAAPYTVRPTELASVSSPVTWDEVAKGFTPEDFNIKNMTDRLASMGDIFAPVLGKGANIADALKKLNTLV